MRCSDGRLYQNVAIDAATSPTLGCSSQCHQQTSPILATRAVSSQTWSPSLTSTATVVRMPSWTCSEWHR
jgi:hypothetical protein